MISNNNFNRIIDERILEIQSINLLSKEKTIKYSIDTKILKNTRNISWNL